MILEPGISWIKVYSITKIWTHQSDSALVVDPKECNLILRPLKRLTQKFTITTVCGLEVTWASVSNGVAYTTHPEGNIWTLEKREAAPRYCVTVWTSWLGWTVYPVTLWCSKSRKHIMHSCDSNWKQCAPSSHVELRRYTIKCTVHKHSECYKWWTVIA